MTDKDLKAFYEFNSMHMEPWDGPAGIVLTDGRYAACLLDRNGLRPARWSVTSDNVLTIASEVGVWPVDPAKVVRKGRVKPGQLFAADLTTGEVLMPEDIDAKLKSAQPYRQWIKESAKVLELSINDDASLAEMSASRLLTCQKMFGMSREERESLIKVLATEGQEAVGSMGDDTPMAVLSQKVRAPYDYLRQQFAQVTNPPIDPIREAVVMSLNTNFGPERNLFVEHPDHALRLSVRSPILSRDKFIHITSRPEAFLKSTVLDLCYDPSEKRWPQPWPTCVVMRLNWYKMAR
jgi:glutamate synthase (NADPH/NADH) large chain